MLLTRETRAVNFETDKQVRQNSQIVAHVQGLLAKITTTALLILSLMAACEDALLATISSDLECFWPSASSKSNPCWLWSSILIVRLTTPPPPSRFSALLSGECLLPRLNEGRWIGFLGHSRGTLLRVDPKIEVMSYIDDMTYGSALRLLRCLL